MARLETTALPSARLPFEQFRTGASTQYTLDAPAPADVVDLVRRRRLEAAVRRLPPFPADLHQLLREMASEDADFRKLEERIAADPALATRVLRMANSAFYSQRDKVCSIARALLVVGLRTARNLILAASLRGALRRPVWLPGFSGSGFLRHSLASAVCCHRLGVVLPGLRAYGEGLFLAGLLHDIGMVALEEFYREAFAMIETANQPVAPDLERRILGLDHLEAGALVARVWDLPPAIAGPMARHHCSAPELKNDPPALAVAVADAWLDAQGYGRAHPADHRRFLEEGTGALGTGVESLTVIFQGFAGEVSSYLGAIT